MQRWLKLPDGRFIDGNRIASIGRIDSFMRIDEDGTDLGLAYSVSLGTDLTRESHTNVVGTKEEIYALMRALLGASVAAPAEPKVESA
ncbi:MAG TPA: hypothetical protein PKO41_02785 [Dokdonella sp.]|uniref:hypothetical protein n=1 Tax=Dokdonella sp. TaxID=2291710 RepID=UPI0025C161D9|nr:hypothetical protein [Dokdonella sp.]MBX3692945.1 hypothetical protein [Dokdonella sp.]MCW5567927.1 hypothetical protein [Dokdonella sp.]HNR91330.1 hypothetical protein [Dokdonella sp.]